MKSLFKIFCSTFVLVLFCSYPCIGAEWGQLRKASVMLNIRQEPTAKSEHVRTLYPGDIIRIGAADGKWVSIFPVDAAKNAQTEKQAQKIGYSFAKYLVKTSSADIDAASANGQLLTAAVVKLPIVPQKTVVASKKAEPLKKVSAEKTSAVKKAENKPVKNVATKTAVKTERVKPEKKSVQAPAPKVIALQPAANSAGKVAASEDKKQKVTVQPAKKVQIAPSAPVASKAKETKAEPAQVADKAALQKAKSVKPVVASSKHTGKVSAKPAPVAPGKAPVRITATKMVYNEKQGTVSFTGNVVAIHAGLTLNSDELTAFLLEKGKKQGGKIDRIEASGNVKMRNEKSTRGSCELLTYHVQTGVLTMKGKPVLTEKENRVEGKEIIFYVRESRSEVVSGGGKQVEAVFYAPEGLKTD